MLSETKKAYSKVLKVLRQYESICAFDVAALQSKSELHLYGLELKETYGLDIEPKYINSTNWQEFGSYMAIGLWGRKHNRTISWSDDGKQPENERLLRISFSGGAYIFGDVHSSDYPKQFFQEFFLELKSYGAKYVDTANHDLYFSMDNVTAIFNEFPFVLNKYKELNRRASKLRKIEKLKNDIEKLEEK